MKKLLLTLILSIAFCGSIFAQYDEDGNLYESNWPDFNYYDFADQQPYVAAIMIDGVIITAEYEGYDALELAFFVGDECRSAGVARDDYDPTLNYLYNGYVEEYGDPFPIIDGVPVYYTSMNEVLSYKLYDHINGILYTECEAIYDGQPIECLTGEMHMEGWDDPENPIFLCFTTPQPETYPLNIVGYGDNEGGYYLISSPFPGVAPADVENMIVDPVDDYDLFAFNASLVGEEWRNYKVLDPAGAAPFLMESGKGYLYARKEDAELTFVGYPYTGDGVIGLNYTGTDLGGWNLVGNPYKGPANVDREYYVLNADGSELLSEATSATMEACQGIFVYAEGEGESVVFTQEEGAKSANVALNLSQGQGIIDRAIIRFSEGRQLPKFQLNPDNTKVYIEQGNKDYSVVSSDGQGEMPVSFKAKENGTYTFTVSSEAVNFGYLHLIDNKTGEDVNLLETTSYTFEATRSDYPSRFRLVFATGDNSESFGFVANNEIVLNGVNANTTVQLIDALGRIVISDNGLNSISTNGMANGVYVLRLINGANTTTQKIVVK